MLTKQILRNCKLCSLHKTRKNPLLGEGNPNAELMFIAQAPGEQEDLENRMFVGPSGKIFRKLLKEADISTDRIYMTNLIKCNLPQNRRPKQREIKACSIYLDEEIESVDPEVLLPLGYYATKYLFEKYELQDFSKQQFHRMIGKTYHANNRLIYILSHPAALLYNQNFRDSAVQYYQKINKINNKELSK